MSRPALLLAVFALALAGCAGDGGAGARETTAKTATARQPPHPPKQPATAVIRFLTAVAQGDETEAWNLLAKKTKRAFKFNRRHFHLTLFPALDRELRPSTKILFERRLGRHAFVLVDAASPNGDPFAAPLISEDGGWRVELFYPQFEPEIPQPGERVRVGRRRLTFDVVRRRDVKVKVRLWLDGDALPVKLESSAHFVNSYSAAARVDRGRHILVAHAITGEGLSGAFAWTFSAR